MRSLFLALCMVFMFQFMFAQQPNYQTYSSVIKLSAFKGSENYQWENKDNIIMLDYKIGDFLVRLKNKDFYNPLHPAPDSANIGDDEREYILKGNFPIRDIINQKTINQTYNVELQLICDDLRLNEPVHFTMTITRPNPSSNGSYRIFMMQGILYNDQLHLPFFEGFNNEIEIFINFNGYFTQ